MSVIFVLLPLALVFVGTAVVWFVWAVRSGQFEDLDTPPVRMLFDDPPATEDAEPSDSASTERAAAREVDVR